MRRLLVPLIAGAVLWFNPQPVTEPTRAIILTMPDTDTPRTSRTTRRQPLQLTDLPAKWQRLAWCESRHHLHAVNNHTYYGLWQIHKGWYKPFGINPKTATLAQQWLVAQHVYKRQGADAWSCTKHTGFQ